MKDAIKRLLREYNMLSAAIIATVGFGMVMEWVVLTDVQMGGLLGLIAAWLLVLRFLVTPTGDPSGIAMGTRVNVHTDKLPTGVVVPVEDGQ